MQIADTKTEIPTVDVVAALIWEEGRFFICQRPAHKARGLLWEFVGGKVERGERPAAALVRECREELGATVEVGDAYVSLRHAYPDLTVNLTLFHARFCAGQRPRRLEHAAFAWISPDQIDQYAFCPADEAILQRIKEDFGNA